MGFQFHHMFLILNLFIVFLRITAAGDDSIALLQSLEDDDALDSRGGTFQLGFFTPGAPPSLIRYLGIWYKNISIRTVVWVANRDKPITGSSGVLKINASTGTLMLLSGDTIVWSSPPPRIMVEGSESVSNPVAQLLDSGNFVLREERDPNPENYLWQSFDYPSDTFLEGMKLGWDAKSGLNRKLVAWKSPHDPSLGILTFGIELTSYPEAVAWNGSAKYFRTGPWNGMHFSGVPELKPNPFYEYYFVYGAEEVYYYYQVKNRSLLTMIVLNQTNYTRRRYFWVQSRRVWETSIPVPRDFCDTYNVCGANALCVARDMPPCKCLKGFRPKFSETWGVAKNWSGGCVRNNESDCVNSTTSRDGFSSYGGLKLPDTAQTWVDGSMTLEECRVKCLKNCSCRAYANADVKAGGSGCVIWFNDLLDIKQVRPSGQDLHVRVSSSDLDHKGASKGFAGKKLIIAAVVAGSILIVLVAGCCIWKSKRKFLENRKELTQKSGAADRREHGPKDLELPSFDLATIAKATSNFSIGKKLGEGGFGPVYKGVLADGLEIAVKRLSESSGQGATEFKNEVILIAKLQHRNLVKLLGCCIQDDERLLVYEYMPNGSLDSFIFDQTRRNLLDWRLQFHIICGIARGLLYLHQDSRLRIIHRDLKAGNVLLDDNMNPKISDFGLARPFGGDQTQGNTKRVVGTFGYMAPEYAVDGLFSIKSDVFSFGVLLLEIVSGRKNRGFYHPHHSLNLIGHAWRLWNEESPLELVDGFSGDSADVAELLRCIHIGLLCVQQRPEDRPNMSSVVLMLGSENAMPQPKQPGYFYDRNPTEEAGSSSRSFCSKNELSITLVEAR